MDNGRHPSDSSYPGLQVPLHAAIIMDGNGRWAEQRGLPRLAGHRSGVENVRPVVEALAEFGVKYASLYTFSTENWNRPAQEVDGIMGILGEVIERETSALHDRGVKVLHLGRLDRLAPELRRAVIRAQEITRENDTLTLGVAFDYGGRAEILEAVRRILKEGVRPEELDEACFSRYLYTAPLPDPDLIIRTGGEMRLSNFFLWQSAYSEYYPTPTLWPDFDRNELAKALESYSNRKRRFGTICTGD